MSSETSSPAIFTFFTARVERNPCRCSDRRVRAGALDLRFGEGHDGSRSGNAKFTANGATYFRASQNACRPQALRHHRAAVRKRPVSHRPHHGVHPGRHLGALPAHAGPRGAFRRRRRRARRADHARRGESRKHRPRSSSRGSQRGRKQYLDGFHISFDNWHSTHSAENVELSQDIFRKLKAAGFIDTKPVEQFFDPVKGMFLAGPLHQGRMPELRREGPVRRRLRELQHGLRAHRAEESVLDALGREAGR